MIYDVFMVFLTSLIAMKIEPDNPEVQRAAEQTVAKINEVSRKGGEKEQRERALQVGIRSGLLVCCIFSERDQDPEVQRILKDPMMAQVLKTLKENPAEAQGYETNTVHCKFHLTWG